MKVRKNGMDFTVNADGSSTCDALKDLSSVFRKTYTDEQVEIVIQEYVSLLRNISEKKYFSCKEREAVSIEERIKFGQTSFDRVVSRITQQTKKMNSFEKFFFWIGMWWYYDEEMILEVSFTNSSLPYQKKSEILTDIIVPILPEKILDVVKGTELSSSVSNHGHFALLFIDEDKKMRRIVTDTQLFEIRDVRGYTYLDVTKEGKPVARSICNRGGGRAFFDGTRLMSHDKFQTCAPATVVIDGGYKVNSTMCTIVNGQLFDLIDLEDKVAHTTGAWFGIVDFSSKDAAEAVSLTKLSGSEMRVENELVTLRGNELKPNGFFVPSKITLLDTGFSLYEYSDFHEIDNIKYDSVLVVDDKDEWVSSVIAEFGDEVKDLKGFITNSSEEALTEILSRKPSAVLLDMHLTHDERFDGLWIANQLASKGFEGKIMIASSYHEEALHAMQKLIRVETIPTGKNLVKIRSALYGKSINK